MFRRKNRTLQHISSNGNQRQTPNCLVLPTKQSFWDRPCITRERQHIANIPFDSERNAGLLTASAPHSEDWPFALPVTYCGLRLDNEAVQVVVALRLGLPFGASYTCQCGAEVDAHGLHGLVCKKAPSRIIHHQHLNDIIARSLSAAGVPTTKKPIGLSRLNVKRPSSPVSPARCSCGTPLSLAL